MVAFQAPFSRSQEEMRSAQNRTARKWRIARKSYKTAVKLLFLVDRKDGGRNWIRTSEGVSQQIYSLPPLATWVSYPVAGAQVRF